MVNDDARPRVEEQIKKEIQQGNYVITSTKLVIASAEGAVTKSDGGYRLQTVLSLWDAL